MADKSDGGMMKGPRKPRSDHFRKPRTLSTNALHHVYSSQEGKDEEIHPISRQSDDEFKNAKGQIRKNESRIEAQKPYASHQIFNKEENREQSKRHGKEFRNHHNVQQQQQQQQQQRPHRQQQQQSKQDSERKKDDSHLRNPPNQQKNVQKLDKLSENMKEKRNSDTLNDTRHSKYLSPSKEKSNKFHDDFKHKENVRAEKNRDKKEVHKISHRSFQETGGDASSTPRSTKMLKLKIGGVTTGSRTVQMIDNIYEDDQKNDLNLNSNSKFASENDFISPNNKIIIDSKKRRHRLILEDEDEEEDMTRIQKNITKPSINEEKTHLPSPSPPSPSFPSLPSSFKSMDANDPPPSSTDSIRKRSRIPKLNSKGEGSAKEEEREGEKERSNFNLQKSKSSQHTPDFANRRSSVESRRRISSMEAMNEFKEEEEEEREEIEGDEEEEEVYEEYKDQQDLDEYKVEEEEEEEEEEIGEEEGEAEAGMNKRKKRNERNEELDELDAMSSQASFSKQSLTARQLSKQKEGMGMVDFPDGLETVASKKKKTKEDSEAERLLKREEQARKRKMYLEKQAKESQASAIQKILGQDSSRRRKEDKITKMKEEMALERKAAEELPAINSIRMSFKQNKTLLSWSNDVNLLSFFSPSISYPPPPEKCIISSCNRAKRYHDSLSNLPLCSLGCYKQLHNLPLWEKACAERKQLPSA